VGHVGYMLDIRNTHIF